MPKKTPAAPPAPLSRPVGSIAVMFDADGKPSLLDHAKRHSDLKTRVRTQARAGELPEGSLVLVMDCTDQSLARFRNSGESAAYAVALAEWKDSRIEVAAERKAAAVPS